MISCIIPLIYFTTKNNIPYTCSKYDCYMSSKVIDINVNECKIFEGCFSNNGSYTPFNVSVNQEKLMRNNMIDFIAITYSTIILLIIVSFFVIKFMNYLKEKEELISHNNIS